MKKMKTKNDSVQSRRLIGLARAWSAYIRMLAAAIITRQTRILSRMNGAEKHA